MDSNKLDLDALAPKPAVITFNGREITVPPPTTDVVLKMIYLGKQINGGGSLPKDELQALMDETYFYISKAIPDLSETALSPKQLMAIINMLVDMGMPPDKKEMENKGVTADEVKKTP